MIRKARTGYKHRWPEVEYGGRIVRDYVVTAPTSSGAYYTIATGTGTGAISSQALADATADTTFLVTLGGDTL